MSLVNFIDLKLNNLTSFVARNYFCLTIKDEEKFYKVSSVKCKKIQSTIHSYSKNLNHKYLQPTNLQNNSFGLKMVFKTIYYVVFNAF